MKHNVGKVRFLVLSGVSVLMLFNSAPTYSQTDDSEKKTTPPEIKVTKVSGELGLYRTIGVEVENLSQYLKQPGKEPGKFTLYLDWRPLRALNPRLAGDNTLMFDLKRTDESKQEWDALLGRPLWAEKVSDTPYLSPSDMKTRIQ